MMSNETNMQLAAGNGTGAPLRRPRLRRTAVFASLALAVSTGLVATFGIGYALPLLHGSSAADDTIGRIDFDKVAELEAMNVDDTAQIVIEGLDAQARNAAIPLAGLPLEKPGKLVLGQSDKSYGAALQCMTQAIYYEAAYEPVEGRRAVAQVVINRMRHPAYPSSICGVVYQGMERRTGCQFSFTCDGSLLRAPAAHAWNEARQIAREALAGHVEPGIGTATHYHADYVLPKWAFELGKVNQRGRHIFYRFKGDWGRATALTRRYSGFERVPQIDFAALRARLEQDDAALAENDFTPGLTVTPHVTDRHAENDVGGRLDMTKTWRLSIPDPASASSRYRETVSEDDVEAGAVNKIAMAGSGVEQPNP